MTPSISRDRLQTLLNAARGKRVLVVGDAMLDEYLIGDVDRISPEAPVPVVRVRTTEHRLGGAANVAQNVVASGALCRLVAIHGADRTSERLLELLRKHGVETEGMVAYPEHPTTKKTRVMARAHQLVRFDEESDGDLTATGVANVLDAIASAMQSAHAVILEDYNKGVLSPSVIEGTIALARKHQKPVVVDPKYRNFFAYRGATVFKPNRRELDAALGAELDVDDPTAVPTAIKRLDVEHLLLTRGERGMLLASRDGSIHEVPTMAREVYDVVGAGDTVTAYLATVLATGGTAVEAAVIANFAAGVEVGKLGAATVSPSEILEAYDEYNAAP